MGLDLNFYKAKIKEELADFRKFYFLSNWISENIRKFENLEYVQITEENMKILKEATESYLESIKKDPSNIIDVEDINNDVCDVVIKCEINYSKELIAFCEEIIKNFDFDQELLLFQAWW